VGYWEPIRWLINKLILQVSIIEIFIFIDNTKYVETRNMILVDLLLIERVRFLSNMKLAINEYIHYRYSELHTQVPHSKTFLKPFLLKLKTQIPFQYLTCHKDLHIVRRLMLRTKLLGSNEIQLLDLFFPADLGPFPTHTFETMIPPQDIFEDAFDTSISTPAAEFVKEETIKTDKKSGIVQETTKSALKTSIEPIPIGVLNTDITPNLPPAAETY
jgi:hypothetical protein